MKQGLLTTWIFLSVLTVNYIKCSYVNDLAMRHNKLETQYAYTLDIDPKQNQVQKFGNEIFDNSFNERPCIIERALNLDLLPRATITWSKIAYPDHHNANKEKTCSYKGVIMVTRFSAELGIETFAW